MMRKFSHLLDYSEKSLGFDVRYFSKNSFYIFLKQLITGFFGFLLAFVLARKLTHFTFGEYNLFFSIMATLSIFSLPGMFDAILNSVIRGFDQAYIKGTKICFKASFLSYPFLLGLAWFYSLNRQPTIALLLFLALFFFPFYSTLNSFEYFLTAKEKFFRLMQFSSFISLSTTVATLVVALLTGKIFLIILTYLSINTLVKIVVFFKTRKMVEKKQSDPQMKKFGVFLSFLAGFSQLVNNLDRIALGFFSGLSSLALFSVANILPAFIEKTLSNLQSVMTPKIIKGGRKGNIEIIKKHLLKIIGFSLLIFLAVYLVTPFFIKTFFGVKYLDSINFSQTLSLQLIFCLANNILGSMLTFQKRKKSLLFFTFYPALPKMLLYLVLIPRFGIWGLIASSVVSRILAFAGLLILNLKKTSPRS